jgi:hypothetical protein
MKARIIIAAILFMGTLPACQFSKSLKKDLISGLSTSGNILSCENAYLSVNGEITSQNTFTYGEEIVLNFNNMEGFKRENDNVFPGMQIFIIDSSGDTILRGDDLYGEYKNGLNFSPLLLTANITAASPMKSLLGYSLFVNIWDKKGTGTFSAKLDFKVVPNPRITIEANKVSFSEVYLYSKEKGKVIPENNIKFNENTYLILEGLSGFLVENGMVFPGLSLKVTDNEGNMILDTKDLFADYNKRGLAYTEFNSQVSSNFLIPASAVKNPLNCELTIWDKKSDSKLIVKTDLVIE